MRMCLSFLVLHRTRAKKNLDVIMDATVDAWAVVEDPVLMDAVVRVQAVAPELVKEVVHVLVA